jgi:hypothetical protein
MARRTRNVPNEAPGPISEAEWRAIFTAADRGELEDPEND